MLPTQNTNNYFYFIIQSFKICFTAVTKIFKTFNNGSLGSRIDEERSEMRNAMRIAEPRVIRSLNASGGDVKILMFVSVWKGITNLNAIEAINPRD